MNKIASLCAISAMCFTSYASASVCGTDKLCVPEDFPAPNGADFQMILLGGTMYVDTPGVQQGVLSATLINPQPITFHASPFSNPAGTSAGTSTLTYSNINHYSVGTFNVLNMPAEFYLQGTGTGSLVDIDGTKGHWSLEVPLYATWNNTQFNFGNVLLSTAAAYQYYGASPANPLKTLIGSSMSYATGDAFLVGQATVTDPTNPFYGFRITLGLNGNDPVVSSVPEASVVGQLLAGLGMMGLVVGARRRRDAHSEGQLAA